MDAALAQPPAISPLVIKTAAVFMSGNSQAVRIPKEFRLSTDQVTIERRPDGIFLREKPRTMQAMLDALYYDPDFPLAPEDGPEEPIEPWD